MGVMVPAVKNPLTDATVLSFGSSQNVADTARYFVEATATTGSLTLTVPNGKSYVVRNAGTTNAFAVGSSFGSVTIYPGEEVRVTWRPAGSVHVVAKIGAAPDGAMSATSMNAVRNSVVKSYIDNLVAANATVTLANIAALRARTDTPPLVYLQGHTSAGDGGGGLFAYLGSGATAGDVDAAGDDDDGWHIVTSSGGNIFGRLDDSVAPEHFGAFAVATHTAARSAGDCRAEYQRAVDFWADPADFPGTAFRPNLPAALEFRDRAGFYRIESTVTIQMKDTGSNYEYQNYYTPGDFKQRGLLFVPFDETFVGLVYRSHRTAGKPRMVLQAYKDRDPSTGRLAWDFGSYPGRYLDDTVLRAWSSTTKFYAGELITQVISSVTYVYQVTLTGITASTAPSTTTATEFTDGTAKLKCIGSSRLANGKNWNDILADNRDIGVKIQDSWEHDGITVRAFNFFVGVAVIGDGATTDACGWTTIDSDKIQGAAVGLLVASYLGERMMAAGGRLTLSDFPIGGMVWETTYPTVPSDAGTKYRFNGPAGGESNPANWSVDSTWASVTGGDPNWANDNTFNLHLVAPYWQGAGTITGSKNQYGVVFTSFGPTYANNNNTVNNLSLENAAFSQSGLNESSQYVFYTGCGNMGHTRTEQPDRTASILAPARKLPGDHPRLNRVTSSRAGKQVSDKTFRLNRTGGYGNALVDAPYIDGVAAALTYEFSRSLNFSSHTRVLSRDLTLMERTSTAATILKNNHLHRISSSSAEPIYYPEDDSWGFNSYCKPVMAIDLIEDFENLAIILLDVHLSPDESLGANRWYRWMAYAMEDDGVTKMDPTLWVAPPVRQVSFSGGLTPATTSATYRWIYPGANITTPATCVLGVMPGVRKVLLGIYGEHVRGFRVQVIGTGQARVYSPFHAGIGAGYIDNLPLIDAAPTKGKIQSPALFRYRSGAAANQFCQLAKANDVVYHCTSGATSGLTPGSALQWGHDGAAQGSAVISQWDGTQWEQIATNAYYVEPTDFANLDAVL